MLRLYADLKRILVVTENLLYLAGRSLQRRAMRNGVLITLAMSSNIVKTNYVGAQSLTGDQLTWLLAGAFASYPAGSLLLRVASFLSRDHIDAAAGGYLHLTSHYKQSRMRLHLEYLWREVFRHDPLQRAAGAGTARVPRPQPPPDEDHLGLFPAPEDLGEDESRTRDRFVAVGLEALRSPLPMGVQSAGIGFHLGPVEDWYEKGFFSYEDFPAKGFSRDPLIRRAWRLVESPHRVRLKQLVAAERAPSFWYAFTVRKFSSMLGKALGTLNADAERAGFPDYFDAQHFIWPSGALDEEVSRRFEAFGGHLERRLREMRRALVREVFSDDGVTARRHVMRMFSRDYAWIFLLRLRLDAAWAADRLDSGPGAELDAIEAAFSLVPVRRTRVRDLAASARTTLAALDPILEDPRSGAPGPAALQLIEVAAHIDYRGLGSEVLAGNREAVWHLLNDPPTGALGDLGFLRELLHRVQLFHALIKMQVLDYWSIVRRIGDLE